MKILHKDFRIHDIKLLFLHKKNLLKKSAGLYLIVLGLITFWQSAAAAAPPSRPIAQE
jgi:hypothetical protein